MWIIMQFSTRIALHNIFLQKIRYKIRPNFCRKWSQISARVFSQFYPKNSDWPLLPSKFENWAKNFCINRTKFHPFKFFLGLKPSPHPDFVYVRPVPIKKWKPSQTGHDKWQVTVRIKWSFSQRYVHTHIHIHVGYSRLVSFSLIAQPDGDDKMRIQFNPVIIIVIIFLCMQLANGTRWVCPTKKKHFSIFSHQQHNNRELNNQLFCFSFVWKEASFFFVFRGKNFKRNCPPIQTGRPW